MKISTNSYLKVIITLCLCFLSINTIYSQIRVPFTQRTAAETPGQTIYSVRGDFTLIGNTNLTLSANEYSASANNSGNMINVNVDGANFPLTNSSSATLGFSTENGADPECSNIIYAGLYWTGRTNGANGTTSKQTVKFRHKDQTSYQNITADANDIYYPGDRNIYAAYAEVTDIVRANGVGEYFTANIVSSTGSNFPTGYIAGWSMVVVYGNELMNWRDITVFDGYAYINGFPPSASSQTLNISGFNAIQNGPVNVKLGVVAAEGDNSISGDYFQIWEDLNNDNVINSFTEWKSLSHSGNSTFNFFNSSIETGGNARNPNLSNNTGLDISMFYLDNTNNSIIDNSDTSTSLRYGTVGDSYVIYNIVMAIDAFVPSIDAELDVVSINGDTNISQPYSINPGEAIEYSVKISNNGNEDLTNFNITIPFPETGDFTPASIQHQVFAPSTTTTAPYYDPNYAPNGAIIWDYGNLPYSPSVTQATLSFKLRASTSCENLISPNCNPRIILENALMTGTGAVSGDPLKNGFIQGYQTTDNCIGEPITEPIVVTLNPSLTIDTNAFNFTVQCDGNGNINDLNNWLNSNGNADIEGNCDVTWTNNFTGLSDECGATGSALVTFTATDACGNSASTTATFTIIDTLSPTLDGFPSCVGVPALNFSNFTEISGDGNPSTHIQGDVYRFTNVSSGVDAIVTIVETVNATIPVFDDNSAGAISFKPQTAFSLSNPGERAYVEYKMDFVTSGSFTPSPLPEFYTNFNDIDGGNSYGEQNYTPFTTSYTVDDPTDLTITQEGPWIVATAGTTEYTGVTNIYPQANITTRNTNTSTFTFRLGVIARSANVSHPGRQHNIQFSCIGNYVNPSTISDEITVECDQLEAAEVLTATDNCGSASVTFNEVRTDGDCPNTYKLERTWTATDLCGNTTARTLTINVQDTTAPTFTAPEDIEIFTDASCNYNATVSETGDVINEADNCDTTLNATFTDSVANGPCEGTFVITRTWTLYRRLW